MQGRGTRFNPRLLELVVKAHRENMPVEKIARSLRYGRIAKWSLLDVSEMLSKQNREPLLAALKRTIQAEFDAAVVAETIARFEETQRMRIAPRPGQRADRDALRQLHWSPKRHELQQGRGDARIEEE